MNNVVFKSILTNKTQYGLIWTGNYNGEDCVIKMIMLATGVTDNRKYFRKDDSKPFYHTAFTDKKSMTINNFMHEVKAAQYLGQLGLAPTFYTYHISDDLYPIHYGFIVTQRVDCSIKDILLKRNLTNNELRMIDDFRSKMHNKYGIIHADFKPSNTGVFLDEKGQIKKIYVFDCQKIKYIKQLSSSDAKYYIKKDIAHFKMHTDKNIKERRKK